MKRQLSPYMSHIFVCAHDRKGERKSCADGVGLAVKDALKAGVEARGWAGRVRVSHTGCQGLCQRGPNVMVYPRGLWFSAVSPADVPALLDVVGEYVKGDKPGG